MTTTAPLVPSPEAPASARACTNCGNGTVDVYCASCGEKQPGHHDLTVGHFTHELFHELFHLDSKLFRTLRDLMVRPGELTAAYFAGRKKRYIAPLRMFLTLFALTFLAYSAYKPVAIYSLEGLMAMDPKRSLDPLFERAAAKRNLPVTELVTRVEYRWQKAMTFLNLLNIISLAALLKLLYVRHRRYFAEHLVFSTHYMCFAYVISLLLWPLYLFLGIGQNLANHAVLAVTVVVSCFYIYLALRRVYGQSGPKTLVKSVAVWGGTFLTSMLLMFGSLIVAIVQVLRS
jgi:hypothetical protein